MKNYILFASILLLVSSACRKTDACSVFGLTVNDIESHLINSGEQGLAMALKETETTNGSIIRLNPGISGSTYPFPLSAIGLGGQISDKHQSTVWNTENQYGILSIDGEAYNSFNEQTGNEKPTSRKIEILNMFNGLERHIELSNKSNTKLLLDFHMKTPKSFFHDTQPSPLFISKDLNGIALNWSPTNTNSQTTFVTVRAGRDAESDEYFFKLYKLPNETGNFLIPASDLALIVGKIPQIHLFRMTYASTPDLRDLNRKNTIILSTSLSASLIWD
jgi:hypothetical protein